MTPLSRQSSRCKISKSTIAHRFLGWLQTSEPAQLRLCRLRSSSCFSSSCRYLLRCALSQPHFSVQAAAALHPQHPEQRLEACLAIVFKETLQACWAAFLDARRRTVTALAPFLQTMVLPSAFQCSGQQDIRQASLCLQDLKTTRAMSQRIWEPRSPLSSSRPTPLSQGEMITCLPARGLRSLSDRL